MVGRRWRRAGARAGALAAGVVVAVLVAPAPMVSAQATRLIPSGASAAGGSCPGAMDTSRIVGVAGVGGLIAVDSVGPDAVWAVGGMGQYTSARPLLVRGSDHGSLQMVAVPELGDLGGSSLNTLDVVDADSVWMGGTGYGVARGDYRPHVLHASGGVVTEVPIPAAVLAGDSQLVRQVTAASDADVWVELQERSYEQRWRRDVSLHFDGVQWHRVELPAPGNAWTLAATSTVGVWAASRDLVARWDGTAWRRAELPPGYQAFSWGELGTNGRDLAISYTTNGLGNGATTFARWTGLSWVGVPPPPAGFGSPVLAPDGTLFAAGGQVEDSQYPLERFVDEVQRWDGTRWVASAVAAGTARETQQGFANVATRTFTATSATAVTAVGDARSGIGAPPSTGTPWVGRWCYSVVRGDGVTRPATTALWDTPVVIRADRTVTSPRTLVDDISLFTPRPVTAGRMTDFSYPGAGTYTARITGVTGTLQTTVPMQVAGEVDLSTLSLWWASAAPPYGWHVEVQEAPAAHPTRFRDISVAQDQTHLPLEAHAPPLRSEVFRSRLVRQDGLAGGWSPIITVTY